MLLWNIIHFAGLGFQIAAGVAGAFFLSWIRTKNGDVEISYAKLKKAKTAGKTALGFFISGAVLLLCYEIRMLQID